MIKLILCVHRREDISAAEFRRYWREEHGPLVAEHAPALRIRRYVQSHAIDDAANRIVRRRRGTLDAFDGIAELWWDSLKDLYRAGLSPNGIKLDGVLVEDERRFVDHSRSVAFFTEEHEVLNTLSK